MNQVSIGSDNGLSPIQRQAIFWTCAGLLSVRPLGTNFGEILTKIQNFSYTNMHLKISSAKRRPCCPAWDELMLGGGEWRIMLHQVVMINDVTIVFIAWVWWHQKWIPYDWYACNRECARQGGAQCNVLGYIYNVEMYCWKVLACIKLKVMWWLHAVHKHGKISCHLNPINHGSVMTIFACYVWLWFLFATFWLKASIQRCHHLSDKNIMFTNCYLAQCLALPQTWILWHFCSLF